MTRTVLNLNVFLPLILGCCLSSDSDNFATKFWPELAMLLQIQMSSTCFYCQKAFVVAVLFFFFFLCFWPSAFLWHKHPQCGSDQRANLFQISHIDNINHSNLSVAVALLFPLLWRLVLITEVSRGLTQFVNPRVPLSASLLRSPLCRAQLDPLPGWEWGGGGGWLGGGGHGGGRKGGMAASIGAPCRDAGDGEKGEEGMEGGYRVLQGAQAGHRLAKEHSLRLWTHSVSCRWYTKPEGQRADFTGIIVIGILFFLDKRLI